MLDGLSRRDEAGVQCNGILKFLDDLLAFGNDALDCLAGLAARRLADNLEKLLQALDLALGLVLMHEEGCLALDEREADTLLAKAGKFASDAESELTRAKELREALYRLFLCESRGNPIGPEDLALVAAMAQRARSQQTLMHAAGVIEWRHVGAEDLNEIGDRLAHFAVGLLTSRQGRRPVRACLGPNCGWLFLDESRGGHRQWCSDKTCGSHAGVRKFRAAKAD